MKRRPSVAHAAATASRKGSKVDMAWFLREFNRPEVQARAARERAEDKRRYGAGAFPH